MREKIILSKTFITRDKLLSLIENIGVNYKFRILKEDTYDADDIDFYRDISDDKFYLIGFQLISENRYGRDPINIEGEDYSISLFITHHSEILNEVNIIIKELLETYPEARVTDETYKNYFSIEDINSGNVDPWLLD